MTDPLQKAEDHAELADELLDKVRWNGVSPTDTANDLTEALAHATLSEAWARIASAQTVRETMEANREAQRVDVASRMGGGRA